MAWHKPEGRASDEIVEEKNDPQELRKDFRESVKKGEKFKAPKVERQIKHIAASEERRGFTPKEAKSIAYGHEANLEKGVTRSPKSAYKFKRARGRPKGSKKVGRRGKTGRKMQKLSAGVFGSR